MKMECSITDNHPEDWVDEEKNEDEAYDEQRQDKLDREEDRE